MSGVRTKFLERDQVLAKLQEMARHIFATRHDVVEVSLFGSLARNDHSLRSDADILILLTSDQRRFIDRIPEFADYFTDAGVMVEVFPYTVQEMQDMKDRSFISNLNKDKIVLASRRQTKHQETSVFV